MGFRKCLACKEVKDKDACFTKDDWKCDNCTGGGGGAAPAAAPSAPAPSAPAPSAAPPAPAAKPAAPTASPASWGVPASKPAAAAAPAPAPAAAPVAGAPMPICKKCGQPIAGSALEAIGAQWHPDCFCCSICQQPIKEVDFAIIDDKPAHEACRPKPDCTRCHKPIQGMFLTAMGAKWHEECFKCFKCGVGIAQQKFFIEEGEGGQEIAVCEGCTPKAAPCGGCGQPVDSGIVALDATWHPECFVCKVCRKALDGPFFPKDNVPCCSKECYAKA